jgi:hypothetical protein
MSNGYPMPNSGLAYVRKPALHIANICLSGSQVDIPYNPDQVNAVNKNDCPSIDYVIAQALGGIPLCLGMHAIGGDTPSDVTFDMMGNPLTKLQTPADIVQNVFGGIAQGQMGATGSGAALKKQTAITNYLNARFASVMAQVSAHDRQVLDLHLTNLRAYETSLTQNLAASSAANSCAVPASAGTVPTDPMSLQSDASVQLFSPFIMQTIAIAFNCHRYRVATVSFGYEGGGGAGGIRMPWLGFVDPMHAVSHNHGDPTLKADYIKMNQWQIGQMAYLMDQLAAVKTPTGTMLDDTVIYLTNRHGDGDSHTNYAVAGVIGGGCGGYFKMGQNLALPTTNPTEVLISLAAAMGVPVAKFGTGPNMATTELTSIKA